MGPNSSSPVRMRISPGEKFVVKRLELLPGELDGQVGVVKETLHLHGGHGTYGRWVRLRTLAADLVGRDD